MLISPSGEIIEEVVSDKSIVFRRKIELDKISNWYINQCRNDIVTLVKGNIDGK